MLTSPLNTQIHLFESLPSQVQVALVGYANAASLPPKAVIEFALTQFLELDPQGSDEPPAIAVPPILAELPLAIQSGIVHYASANEMPPDFVIELAIAHFFDPDAVTFDDCQIGVQREQVERLKQHYQVYPPEVLV